MENKDSRSRLILISIIILLCIIFVAIFVIQSNMKGKELINTPIAKVNTSEILGNKEDLVYFSVNAGQEVSGVLNVVGSVKGGYFFEANILVNILDINKNILKTGYGNAITDWMTSEPVSFESNIDFSGLPKGSAYIEIKNDDPSNGEGGVLKTILIPIIIG